MESSFDRAVYTDTDQTDRALLSMINVQSVFKWGGVNGLTPPRPKCWDFCA